MSLFGDNHNCSLVSDCEHRVGGTRKGIFCSGRAENTCCYSPGFTNHSSKGLFCCCHMLFKWRSMFTAYHHAGGNETVLYNSLWKTHLSSPKLQNLQNRSPLKVLKHSVIVFVITNVFLICNSLKFIHYLHKDLHSPLLCVGCVGAMSIKMIPHFCPYIFTYKTPLVLLMLLRKEWPLIEFKSSLSKTSCHPSCL